MIRWNPDATRAPLGVRLLLIAKPQGTATGCRPSWLGPSGNLWLPHAGGQSGLPPT
jgi:hypothetical protein